MIELNSTYIIWLGCRFVDISNSSWRRRRSIYRSLTATGPAYVSDDLSSHHLYGARSICAQLKVFLAVLTTIYGVVALHCWCLHAIATASSTADNQKFRLISVKLRWTRFCLGDWDCDALCQVISGQSMKNYEGGLMSTYVILKAAYIFCPNIRPRWFTESGLIYSTELQRRKIRRNDIRRSGIRRNDIRRTDRTPF